ncbi:MAG TPA: hypothetical protein VMV84_03545 [Dehalococcoidales bacterium]|nr:hypothetical protein [Dehalococcoidales bacterium]
MGKCVEASTVGKEICEALGLAKVVNLDIRLHLGEVAEVTVLYYPDEEHLQKITPILAKYGLIPI